MHPFQSVSTVQTCDGGRLSVSDTGKSMTVTFARSPCSRERAGRKAASMIGLHRLAGVSVQDNTAGCIGGKTTIHSEH